MSRALGPEAPAAPPVEPAHAIDEAGLLPGDPAHAAPRLVAGGAHAKPEQRPGGGGHERGLVRPVLDEVAAVAARTVPQGVEAGRVVRPEPRVERQVLRAGDRVDAIDLHDAETIRHGPQLRATDLPTRPKPRAETLRGQRDSARLRPAQDGLGHVWAGATRIDGAGLIDPSCPRRDRPARQARSTHGRPQPVLRAATGGVGAQPAGAAGAASGFASGASAGGVASVAGTTSRWMTP